MGLFSYIRGSVFIGEVIYLFIKYLFCLPETYIILYIYKEIFPMQINNDFAFLLDKLSKLNGFIREKNIFISKDGKRYVATNLGFCLCETYNLHKEMDEQRLLIANLSHSNELLQEKYNIVYKEIKSEKNLLKIANIIKGEFSDGEKVKQIRKYLSM